MDTSQTMPSPAWGGGQNQQFAPAERNKKNRNRIVERDNFFASATYFPHEAKHPKEDENCLTADYSKEDEICLTADYSKEDEISAPEKTVPRGLGPLSPKEQEDILALHVPEPLQTSLPLVPVAQGSYAEAMGIEPSPPHNTGPPGPRGDPYNTGPPGPRRDPYNTGTLDLGRDPYNTGPLDPRRDPYNTGPLDPRRDPYNTGPPGPRREQIPIQLRLPADHPLKVELAQVEALRKDRKLGWDRLERRFEEKNKDPKVPLTPEQIIAQKQAKATHKREEHIIAQNESRLLWFIRQLETGEPVGRIGLRHEQLQQIIEYNARPPAPQNVGKPMRRGRNQRRRPPYMASAPSPRPIPKPQQTINADTSSTNPIIAASPSHVQADGHSNDEFIDIDSIVPNVVIGEIEVIDITGDDEDE